MGISFAHIWCVDKNKAHTKKSKKRKIKNLKIKKSHQESPILRTKRKIRKGKESHQRKQMSLPVILKKKSLKKNPPNYLPSQKNIKFRATVIIRIMKKRAFENLSTLIKKENKKRRT